MEDWAIALIAVGCAVAAGLIVGLSVYAVLDKRRKRRGNHDPFSIADSSKSDQTDAQFAHTGTAATSFVASRSSLAERQVAPPPRLPNQPYQRYSLNIGDYAPKILGGTLLQPPHSQVTTVPARGSAHYSSFYTPQLDATFPPPRNLPMNDIHRSGAHWKSTKMAKTRKPEHYGSETDLYLHANALAIASPAASFVNSAAQSFVSDSGIRANSTLSTEPIYQRKSQTAAQVTAALKSESAMKKDRKDTRKWNSLGNLNESEGEAEFSDPKLVTGGPGPYGLTGSAQPYSYAPFLQGNARPPSFKHYSKYNEEQVYYNAAQVIEQDAQQRSKHSSLVVVPTYQSGSTADSDLLALNRGASVTSTNWQTRPKVQGPTASGQPTKNAAAMPSSEADSTNFTSKPLARILPNANGTEPIYSKVSRISDQHTFAPIRGDSANQTPTPTPDVTVAATLSKIHTPILRTAPPTPAPKPYPETPTRDLQAVTDAFDFLNAINV